MPTNIEDQIAYLLGTSRSVTVRSGLDPDRKGVSNRKHRTLPETDVASPFKGIEKATPARPLDHADMGLFHVEIETSELDAQRFTATTIKEALDKAVHWLKEKHLEQSA